MAVAVPRPRAVGTSPARAARSATIPMENTVSDESSNAEEGPLRCEKCEEDFDTNSLWECYLCNELYCQRCLGVSRGEEVSDLGVSKYDFYAGTRVETKFLLTCKNLENDHTNQLFFGAFTFSVGPQQTCSGCQNEGNDSDDGDFASDRAVTYAESDHGSVSCKSKRRRRSSKNPTSSSPREPLMLPKDDEQAELMFKLYRNAKEMERQLKEENKRISETRNLTLLDLTDAASYLSRGVPISRDTWRKLEKEDYGLYGITVRQAGAAGETISGTKVTSEGRTGEVEDAKME